MFGTVLTMPPRPSFPAPEPPRTLELQTHDRIRTAQENPWAVRLNPEEIDDLDCFLRTHFGIRPLTPDDDWHARVEDLCSPSQFDRFRRLQNQRSEEARFGGVRAATDAAFFEYTAQDPLFGLVHSLKRTFILDAAAVLTALFRHLEVEGPVLDVGCHGGYHALWLAQRLGLEVVGLDASECAVAYAEAKRRELDLSSQSARFVRGRFPQALGRGRYDAIYSIDGPVTLRYKHLRPLSAALRPGGLLVVIQDGGIDSAHVLREAHRVGLGLAYVDVTGGWDYFSLLNGEPWFQSKIALGFIEGAEHAVQGDLRALSSRAWDEGFITHNNTDGTPWAKKTMACYRAKREATTELTVH